MTSTHESRGSVMKPEAREDGLIVKEFPDEVLVYDRKTHRAHCLNQSAGLVWRHCDGQSTVKDIAKTLKTETASPVTEKFVWLALERLGRARLLRERVELPPEMRGHSRREWMRRVARVGRLSLLIPLVTSILTPTPVQAAGTCVISCSGQPDLTPYAPPGCANICLGGFCT